MSTIWVGILGAAVISLTVKAAGPALVGHRQLPAWVRGVIALLAPALLAALVVTDVFGPHWSTLNGPVLGGLAATAAAKILRAPLLLAVIVGVAATALIRLAVG
jgi:branched-subunit amino acid transport protein